VEVKGGKMSSTAGDKKKEVWLIWRRKTWKTRKKVMRS